MEFSIVLENKLALVVEDDAHSLFAISSILRDLGISFKRNTTGANVLDQLHAMNPLPDFVLLDIDLPQGDAFAINHLIHADPRLAAIPIIAIGSEQVFTLLPQIRHAGFASFLGKPFPRRQFGEILQRILDGGHFWELTL
jgi:CheY-like chemotaxis protein